ncbi:MAG TPA: hypothetical protein VJ463_03275 [Geothrix sp.]|nr:hypothetical protein [Geothrix sp.]
MKHFREEEARLARARAQDGAKRRSAHRRLVERLGGLMGDLDLGLDVALGIQAFIRAWLAHQETAALRGASEEPGHGGLGHFDAGRSASSSLWSGDHPEPWRRMVAVWPGPGPDEDSHGPERLHPPLPGLRPAGAGG